MASPQPWDPRLARQYAGPDDPAFRKDTLVESASLHMARLGGLPFCMGDWGDLADTLKLHHASSPEECAERALALLQPGQGRAKELAAIAAWLGRDRASLRLTGDTPLEAINLAFQRDWDETEREIAAAREKGTAMLLVSIGDAAGLRRAIAAGQPFDEADDRQRTPLQLAAKLSLVDCIKMLLKAAEEKLGDEGMQEFVDAADEHGCTALHRAILWGNEETIKLLLKAGASTHIKEEDRGTVLHEAVTHARMSGQLWRLQVLLDHAVDLDTEALDGGGEAALHVAVKSGELECIKALLDAKADVDVRNEYGCTPLHVAVQYLDMDVVELLLEAGANVGARNDDYQTPVDLADELEDADMADLLTQRQRLDRLRTSSSRRLRGSGSSRSMKFAEEVPEGEECVVCRERPKVVIIAPCGHRCMCKLCTRSIMTMGREQRKCPMCTEKIESFVTKVFG